MFQKTVREIKFRPHAQDIFEMEGRKGLKFRQRFEDFLLGARDDTSRDYNDWFGDCGVTLTQFAQRTTDRSILRTDYFSARSIIAVMYYTILDFVIFPAIIDPIAQWISRSPHVIIWPFSYPPLSFPSASALGRLITPCKFD